MIMVCSFPCFCAAIVDRSATIQLLGITASLFLVSFLFARWKRSRADYRREFDAPSTPLLHASPLAASLLSLTLPKLFGGESQGNNLILPSSAIGFGAEEGGSQSGFQSDSDAGVRALQTGVRERFPSTPPVRSIHFQRGGSEPGLGSFALAPSVFEVGGGGIGGNGKGKQVIAIKGSTPPATRTPSSLLRHNRAFLSSHTSHRPTARRASLDSMGMHRLAVALRKHSHSVASASSSPASTPTRLSIVGAVGDAVRSGSSRQGLDGAESRRNILRRGSASSFQKNGGGALSAVPGVLFDKHLNDLPSRLFVDEDSC